MYYPPFKVQNDGITGHWSVTPTSNDVALNLVNDGEASDHALLPKYETGRYLVMEKPNGSFIISEIMMTFAEMRESNGARIMRI